MTEAIIDDCPIESTPDYLAMREDLALTSKLLPDLDFWDMIDPTVVGSFVDDFPKEYYIQDEEELLTL